MVSRKIQSDRLLVTNDSLAYNGTAYSLANNLLLGPKTLGAWGFIGSFRVNLPMIAPGDQVNFQYGYGHGFIGAVLSTGGLSDLSNSSNKRGLGGVIRTDADIVPTSAGGTSVGLTDAWGVDLMYTHYWTPSWRSNATVQYAEITPPSLNASAPTFWGQGKLFVTSANLIWAPIKNFNIGIEAEYLNLTSKLQNPSVAFVNAGEPGLKSDGFVYHLRLERQF